MVFVTFDNILSHIFSENVIEIPQIVQKIWKSNYSILAIFINFLDFLALSCYFKLIT